MSSSSLKRFTNVGSKVHLPVKNCAGRLRFTSSPSEENGLLRIPSYFVEKFGGFGLETVGLHLPNGRTWIGKYIKERSSIEGLETFMNYYAVTSSHMFAFEFIGGTEFLVEIFNQYAVEIDYSTGEEYNNSRSYWPTASLLSTGVHSGVNAIEKEKLEVSFYYNAFTNLDAKFAFVINEDHLQVKIFNKILSAESCAILRLDDNMSWLEIGLKLHKWKIDIHWEDGIALFNSEWNTFANAANLVVGDTCMLVRTDEPQTYRAVVFEKADKRKFNRAGTEQNKGLLKWFKIINSTSIDNGVVELPYVFAELYGNNLPNKVNLVFPDGFLYDMNFNKEKKLIYGMRKLISKYAVGDMYGIFFEYVGKDTFYVNVYNQHALEVFNNLADKVVLQTVINWYGMEVHVLSDSSDHSEGGNKMDSSVSSEFVVQGPFNTDENRVGVSASQNTEVEYLNQFTQVLMKSHVDQRGHGVFVPTFLHHIYRHWKKGTTVKLRMKTADWNVEVLRRKKTCRFGIGWNQFVLNNNLQVGQKLCFTYLNNQTFVVDVIA